MLRDVRTGTRYKVFCMVIMGDGVHWDGVQGTWYTSSGISLKTRRLREYGVGRQGTSTETKVPVPGSSTG